MKNTDYANIRKNLIERVETQIEKTFTGELRNLLTDINIILQTGHWYPKNKNHPNQQTPSIAVSFSSPSEITDGERILINKYVNFCKKKILKKYKLNYKISIKELNAISNSFSRYVEVEKIFQKTGSQFDINCAILDNFSK